MRSICALLGLLCLCACGREDQPKKDASVQPSPKPAAPDTLVVKVDGMIKAEGGKTWMAWPEAVVKALEGLPGVAKVDMDVDHDLFRITYPAGVKADSQAAFQAIRDLGYTPSLAKADQFQDTPAKSHPSGGIPAFIQRALDRAKAEGKLVLVDCTAEWWGACKQMSVKTFNDPTVKKIIDERFVFVELNVENEKEAAGWFASAAIPDTWILSPDGKMLDRVVGFESAEKFAQRLTKVLESRK